MEIPHTLLEMNFLSEELGKNTQVDIILPAQADEGRPCKTLWLFHGIMGDHTSWLRNTNIERYAAKHNLCVVMPNADRCWYTNTQYGVNYMNYITKELPEVCRRNFKIMSARREDNIVAGLSMGGYGALKTALTFPENYGYCISLSGVLNVTRVTRMHMINEMRSVFGYDVVDMPELMNSEHDLAWLAEKNKNAGLPFPKIYMWCGLEDKLLDASVNFSEELTKLGIPHTFEKTHGNHTWHWWNAHILPALNHVLAD